VNPLHGLAMVLFCLGIVSALNEYKDGVTKWCFRYFGLALIAAEVIRALREKS